MEPLARRLPYLLVCTLLGAGLGWLPILVHGPAPEKFDLLYIRGAIAVWGFYLARCSIGFWIGVTTLPERWWLRGPLVGFLVMLPLGIVLLATPGCQGRCTMWNLSTGTVVGALVAGAAFLLTGKHRL
jgi:hypothetical protein